ncbi:MAG: hypothetical protein IJJ29_12380 [Solobacterium sp.]|nr:hypothetical protein [Solobacterium sp.]
MAVYQRKDPPGIFISFEAFKVLDDMELEEIGLIIQKVGREATNEIRPGSYPTVYPPGDRTLEMVYRIILEQVREKIARYRKNADTNQRNRQKTSKEDNGG